MKKIKLPHRKFAIVDDEDFLRVNKFKWHYSKVGSIRVLRSTWHTGGVSNSIAMSHYVLKIKKLKKGVMIDHINRNPFDNRKKNLRLCDAHTNVLNCGKNSKNISGYKGVSWSKKYKRWDSRAKYRGETVFLGYFTNKKKAFEAYKNYHKIHNPGIKCW